MAYDPYNRCRCSSQPGLVYALGASTSLSCTQPSTSSQEIHGQSITRYRQLEDQRHKCMWSQLFVPESNRCGDTHTVIYAYVVILITRAVSKQALEYVPQHTLSTSCKLRSIWPSFTLSTCNRLPSSVRIGYASTAYTYLHKN